MSKPTKPNITIPKSFAANGVKADFDNNKILNGFDRIQPDVLAGDNLNKFIDDTYKASNYALDLGDYIDEKVSKSGDTMTGTLSIKPTNYVGSLHLYNSNLDYTNNEAPTNNDTFGIIQWRDKNGQWAGYCQVDERADGIRRIIQSVRRNINGTQATASLGLQIDQQGNESLYTTKGIRREFTKLSFPSTKYTTFTVGESLSTITAPANGYVSFMGNTSATSNAFVYLASNGVDSQGNGDGASNKNIHCSIPVAKGATVLYTYSNVKDMTLRFIYAQGDQG